MTGKMLITMLIINLIAVMFATEIGVVSIGNEVTDFLFPSGTSEKIQNENININGINQDLDDGLSKELTPETASAFDIVSGFVDGLKKVFVFIINILTLGFSLFYMLIKTGAPYYICILIGLPVAFAYYLGLVSFIRGFEL
jgi:hypothetical protein